MDYFSDRFYVNRKEINDTHLHWISSASSEVCHPHIIYNATPTVAVPYEEVFHDVVFYVRNYRLLSHKCGINIMVNAALECHGICLLVKTKYL